MEDVTEDPKTDQRNEPFMASKASENPVALRNMFNLAHLVSKDPESGAPRPIKLAIGWRVYCIRPKLLRAWLSPPSERNAELMGEIRTKPGDFVGEVVAYEHTMRFSSVKIKHPNEFGQCWINVWTNRNLRGEIRGCKFAVVKPPTKAGGDPGEKAGTQDPIVIDDEEDAHEPWDQWDEFFFFKEEDDIFDDGANIDMDVPSDRFAGRDDGDVEPEDKFGDPVPAEIVDINFLEPAITQMVQERYIVECRKCWTTSEIGTRICKCCGEYLEEIDPEILVNLRESMKEELGLTKKEINRGINTKKSTSKRNCKKMLQSAQKKGYNSIQQYYECNDRFRSRKYSEGYTYRSIAELDRIAELPKEHKPLSWEIREKLYRREVTVQSKHASGSDTVPMGRIREAELPDHLKRSEKWHKGQSSWRWATTAWKDPRDDQEGDASASSSKWGSGKNWKYSGKSWK